MDSELPRTEKKELLKSNKIQIFPNQQQKQKIKQWMGAYRWTYNKCLEWRKSNKISKNFNKKYLRSQFINTKSIKDEKPYVNNVPYDVRDAAMCDLMKNLKSNFAKVKNKTINNFNLKFNSIKKSTQSISIRHRDYGRKSGRYAFLKDIKKSEPIDPSRVIHDFRILRDNIGNYFMCIPIDYMFKGDRQAKTFSLENIDGVISLDPGVRTFMTGFDPFDKNVIHFAPNAIDKLYDKCLVVDSLESEKSKLKGKKRKQLRKALLRLRQKIRNMVKDMHFKVAKFLCLNYKVILLPIFETQGMTRNNNKSKRRKIHKKTVRQMLTLSHYLFKQRLINKSYQFRNCNVVIVDESYTSKTCSNCGKINTKLGGSKTFNCVNEGTIKGCNMKMDRDVNGARNIFIKNNC